jgi:UDP-glucose 4-epimerase
MTLRECAELLETPIRRMPLRAYRGLARTMWAARLSEAPPGQIEFALHPWVVSTDKLKRTTGWQPRHTTRETFEITMRAHGKLPPEGPPASANGAGGVSAETRSSVV